MVTGGNPFVNQQSGNLTPNSYKFELALFNRTGAGTGIVPVVQTGLVAQGNGQSNALLLAADWNRVDTVTSGSGVVMPTLQPGNDISVWNNGGNNLEVYPFSGAAINGGTVNAGVSLTPGQLAYFQCWTTTNVLQVITVSV
jgi:hypothetical protein